MTNMEWKKVEPNEKDWEKQIDIVAYDGNITIGSIAYCGADFGWIYIIGGHSDSLLAKTEYEAKRDMITVLDNHFVDEINYYKELKESLSNLN